MTDLLKVHRDMIQRDRQRKQAGAQITQVTFQIPVQGKADNGLLLTPTERINFGVAFSPEQGERFAITPAVLYGFSIESDGEDVPTGDMLGLLGTANVASWATDTNGYYVGAIAHVGVVHLGVLNDPVPYRGYCNISFIGKAIQQPRSMPNREYRRTH